MADEFSGELISGDFIYKELVKRRRKVIHDPIRSNNKDALEKMREAKELQGWRVAKRYKSSITMEIDKPADELLEDDIWTIMAKMGFHEINKDRNFKIKVESLYRQIDILAKDTESIVLIECTQTDVPKKKSMSSLIEKIYTQKGGVASSVVSRFGKKIKWKIGWAIATRNIEWSQEDIQRAKDYKIAVLRDRQIDYFSKLSDHLKDASRYQFLAYIFKDEDIPGLHLAVPATRGQMGKKTFYNFVMAPTDLIKISYVSHKASADIESVDTYQRLISKTRLSKIAKYIDSGGQFPTNIVINIRSNRPLRFDQKDVIGSSAFGTLYLPAKYACAWVIDGQHRLFGYAHSQRASKKDDKTTFPVLAYENLPLSEESRMFVDINHEQVSVPTNLLKEIYLTLHWNTDNFKEKIDALASRVVLRLDQTTISPFHDRIIFTNRGKTSLRCITLTQFSESLKENKFFGEEKGNISLPGPLTHKSTELDQTLHKAYLCIYQLFEHISSSIPQHWSCGDDAGGFLATNMGIRSLMRVFRAILSHIEKSIDIDLYILDPPDFMPKVIELLAPIIKYFEQADANDVMRFRSQRAMAGVSKNSYEMLRLVNATYSNFSPPGLQEYINRQDEEGTKEARGILDQISGKLHSFVITKLKTEFGNDWWRLGIPEKVRVEKATLKEKDGSVREPEMYLYLIDYRDIAVSNWSFFEKNFTLDQKGSKTDRTKWLVELNNIRKITHYPEKGILEKEQVEFVRGIKKKIDTVFI